MPQLSYRTIDQTDYELFVQIEAHAFNEDLDLSRLKPEILNQLRGLYVDGRLVSQLQLYPHTLTTGFSTVSSGGIGSVATTPEQRRRGYTGILLRHTCDELRASGVPFSMLFPFDRAFYHRYGWASAMERKSYYGKPKLFSHFPISDEGAFERVGSSAIGDLNQVYEGALRGRFGPLVRDERHWREQVLQGWDKKNLYHSYLWRDRAGAPRAYIIYWVEQPRNERILRCREAVSLDPLARSQIFAFFANHDAHVDEIVLRTPADAPIQQLLRNQPRCEVDQYFMLRIVDVALALTALPYPRDAQGRLTIRIADDWLEYNQGVFEFEVAGGAAQCCRLPDDTDADLACDVRVLAQIVTRYLRPRTAAAFGELEVSSRPALTLLDQCFNGLVPFFSDYF